MKCTIPEISWHNREPVLTVDIHPVSDNFYKLASGGGDSHILIWQMVLCENGSVKQEVISDLTRHQKSVNTVRWSSTGQYLASADDDANIIVWQLKTDNIPLLEGETDDKEVWIVHKVLRGHKEDIYDLCWSVDNLKLLSGSVDNTAILWDLAKGKLEHIMTDHKGFVQGVAWDPKDQFIATISTDRFCRIFDTTGKQVKARIHKGKLPVPAEHFLHDKESKYFHDDTFKSFFRRCQFTPDGSLLIVPSGHFQADDCKRILNSTLIFTLDNWTEPAVVLPLDKQSSTVVRCCPILFQHRENGPEPMVKLPYRIIFAVGTDHDVILYDTQQTKPFARFHEIHYTRITDITWSGDGLILIASSTDGFCSLITFEPKELGEEYVKKEVVEENKVMEVSEITDIAEKNENIDITNKNLIEKEEVKKRPSFLVQWAQNPPKKAKVEKANADKDGVIELDSDTEKPKEVINKLIPRRAPNKIENNNDKPSTVEENSKKEVNILTPRRVTPNKIEIELDKEPKEKSKDINILIPRKATPKKVESNATKDAKVEENLEALRALTQDNTNSKVEANTEDINKLTPTEVILNEAKSTVVNDSKLEVNSKENVTPSKAAEKAGCIEENDKLEDLPKDIKEGIKLTPRRITPKKVGECSKKESVGVEEKPIESKTSKLVKDETKPTPVKRKLIEDNEIGNTNKNNDNNTKQQKHKILLIANNNSEDDVIVLDKVEERNTVPEDSIKGSSKIKSGRNTMKTDVNKNTPKSDKAEPKRTESNSTNCTPSSNQRNKGKDQSKTKIGSLVKKKLKATPTKINTLLDFLQKSGEKKRKQKVVTEECDFTYDQEEARDGFSKQPPKNGKKSADSSPDAVPLDEHTEDFCLQLEDSQKEESKNKSSCDMMEVEEIVRDKKSSEVIEISDDSCSSPLKSITDDRLLQKKPRRVPLITLSSPKGKNKPTVSETGQK